VVFPAKPRSAAKRSKIQSWQGALAQQNSISSIRPQRINWQAQGHQGLTPCDEVVDQAASCALLHSPE